MYLSSIPRSLAAVALLTAGTSLAATATAGAATPTVTAASTTTMKAAWTNPTTPIRTTLTSRALTQSDVGATVTMRVTPDSTSTIVCSGFKLTQNKAGVTTAVAPDYSASGCYSGAISLVTKVTSQMVGATLTLTVGRTPVGSPTLAGATGKVTIGSTTTSASITSTRPASTPVHSRRGTVRTPSTSSATAPNTSGNSTDGSSLSSLPRIPWEGGASYYAQFPDTKAAGWADPNHFPIAVWWGRAGTDAQVKRAKQLGINTYVILNDGTDAGLLKANGMSYIGKNALQNMQRGDSTWAGDFLEDEADAWGGSDVLNILDGKAKALPDHNKFRYANFTAMTYSWFQNNPTHDSLMKAAVNNYSDVISSDAYWYLGSQCDKTDVQGDAFYMPFTKANCRTPQAYGRNVTSLRWRDSQDGKLQPTWNFIENISGGTDDGVVHYTQSPAEIAGAGMNSIIHEARGLVWFDQSFGNTPCSTGDAVGETLNASYPAQCKADVEAMGKVNNLVQSLAPVLNTQSYKWSFGDGLDTMLKVKDGSAYVFAMPTDAGTNSGAGTKTFTVPAALRGKTISVVGENRTIAMKADGTFTDNFAALTSYHVYKIG